MIVGGASRDRTGDLYNAIVALSQLSYGPTAEPRKIQSGACRCQGFSNSGNTVQVGSSRHRWCANRDRWIRRCGAPMSDPPRSVESLVADVRRGLGPTYGKGRAERRLEVESSRRREWSVRDRRSALIGRCLVRRCRIRTRSVGRVAQTSGADLIRPARWLSIRYLFSSTSRSRALLMRSSRRWPSSSATNTVSSPATVPACPSSGRTSSMAARAFA